MNIFGDRARRGLVLKSVLGAVVVGAVAGGVYYTGTSATANEPVAASSFACVAPGGAEVAVPIEFGVDAPESVVAGVSAVVRPRAVITLPAGLVGQLRASGESLDATVVPVLTLTEGEAATVLEARPLVVRAMGVPEAGELVLDIPGAPVSFTPKAQGAAKVELTGLTATIAVGAVEVPCRAVSQAAALGTFTVVAGDAVRPPQAPAGSGGGVSARALPPPPAESGVVRHRFAMEITTRLAKVGAEVKLTGEFISAINAFGELEGRLRGQIDVDPADVYLVVFRFMPVTNTIALDQREYAAGTAELLTDPDTQVLYAQIQTKAAVYLKVSNVRQDGVPLDVGAGCETASPLVLDLSGRVNLSDKDPVSFLEGMATIPAFAPCGTREDVAPLLGGLVSGPGNKVTVKLTLIGSVA
ncbi:hypothetical protein ACOBQX_04895 [Actinokineospora sp. G85]|uniref:hypothetical protein n=1 Tax=Actinokineospora sp. G85 TaxID=3406626 RepID=UPI003C7767AE